MVPFTATSTEQCLQAALNSPSLSVDFNGPKWLKTGEGMFNNRLNTEHDKEQHRTESRFFLDRSSKRLT